MFIDKNEKMPIGKKKIKKTWVSRINSQNLQPES